MRIHIAAVAFWMAILASSCAYADGMFVGRAPTAKLDPKSHVRDITEPSQKALIVYDKGTEYLVLQVSYKGDVSEFAWLVPTPSRPEVSKVGEPIFHLLHTATAPKLRYWFDADLKLRSRMTERHMGAPGMGPGGPGGLDVQVLQEKQVGVYDIAVLKAGNAGDLLQWLKQSGYEVTPDLGPVLSDYIGRGWVFTAMRITTGYQGRAGERLREGVLESLLFKFPAPDPVYPLKVSSLNNGKTDLLLYVIAERRVEDPLLRTACCLDFRRSGMWYRMPSAMRFQSPGPSTRLTKLTATLSPAQMTHDLVLTTSARGDIMPVKDVSPPFLENLGASTLLFWHEGLGFPRSLGILGLAGLFALSPAGRKRWRLWLAAGIIFVMASIPTNGPGYERGPMLDATSSAHYTAVGTWSVVILCAITVAAAVLAIRGRLWLRR